MNSKIRQIVFPLMAAMIWGMAFVAQSLSAGKLGTFTLNMFRSLIGSLALFPLALYEMRKDKKNHPDMPENIKRKSRAKMLSGGIICGVFLAAGSLLQQKGLETTSAGKSGFITALYVVLVPVFGLFFKKKASITVWISVALALFGLFLLCVKPGEDLTLSSGDIVLLLCAIMFAGQILAIDAYTPYVNGIVLSWIQMISMFVICLVGTLLFELSGFSWHIVGDCLPYLLYLGVMSTCVAFTLQILAQKGTNPTVVSLLLCLESFFSVVAGAIILHEILSGREYVGCAVMLTAVMLSQIPAKKRR